MFRTIVLGMVCSGFLYACGVRNQSDAFLTQGGGGRDNRDGEARDMIQGQVNAAINAYFYPERTYNETYPESAPVAGSPKIVMWANWRFEVRPWDGNTEVEKVEVVGAARGGSRVLFRYFADENYATEQGVSQDGKIPVPCITRNDEPVRFELYYWVKRHRDDGTIQREERPRKVVHVGTPPFVNLFDRYTGSIQRLCDRND